MTFNDAKLMTPKANDNEVNDIVVNAVLAY